MNISKSRFEGSRVELKRFIVKALCGAVVFLAFCSSAAASNCDFVSACQAFTRADAVFVGKVVEVKRGPSASAFFQNTVVAFGREGF